MHRLFCLILLILWPGFVFSEILVDDIYDFGVVSEGTVVEHEFTVQNAGDQEVRIQNLIPGCGCTAAVVSSKTLMPGAESTIKVTFDTNGFLGRKDKKVRVLTTGVEDSSFILTLQGEILSDVSVSPSRIFLGSRTQSELMDIAGIPIKVEIKSDSQASILDVLNPSKHLKIVSEQGDEKSRTIKLAFKKNIRTGQLRERLIVNLKNSNRDSINIPVFVNITKELRFEPAVVSFGVIKSGQVLERKIKVRNYAKTAVKVIQVESDNPALKANLKTIKSGYDYVIELSLNPESLVEELTANLTITTDDRKNSEHVLSVFGILPPHVKALSENS